MSHRTRDPRLDFFRGIAMFIILIAHIPGNSWNNWIPARFGFSDATEIFVFCSGMASAIAFGKVFDTHGLAVGGARILFRFWQIYWAQIGLFIAILALLIAAGLRPDGLPYSQAIEAERFFAHAHEAIPGLVTLSYHPPALDILPMYMVILLLVPVVMAFSRLSLWLVAAFCAALWAATNAGLLDLPAEPWSDRVWFFNPFAWQVVFFTGFAIMRGWLRVPRPTPLFVLTALAVVIVTIPFAWEGGFAFFPRLGEIYDTIDPLIDKTRFGVLRYVHFLAVAYLAMAAVGERGSRIGGAVADTIRRVGQQSLAVFIGGEFVAQCLGILLDRIGRDEFSMLVVNVLGGACLIAIAAIARWFKSGPWKRPPDARQTVHHLPDRMPRLAGE